MAHGPDVKPRDIVELLLLAAIWGASFIFMRLAVPSFGAMPVTWLRVLGAALLLLPIFAVWGDLRALRPHAGAIAAVGVVGSALPFALYGIASLALTAGTMSILNATTPMWGALVVWAWLGERSSLPRIAGLLLGVVGVFGLAWDQAPAKEDTQALHPVPAIGACLAAAFCYALAAAFTKRRLAGVAPIAVAAGSQLANAIVLAPPAILLWPATTPGAAAWTSAAALALLCTGVAMLLYFRLIARVGAANATTVTFLIPLFAVLWGTLLLREPLTPAMVVAGALVLLGTALATGVLGGSKASAARGPRQRSGHRSPDGRR